MLVVVCVQMSIERPSVHDEQPSTLEGDEHRLRRSLHSLLHDTKQRQHEIASDAQKLRQVLYKANEHLIHVKKPTEAALDAEVMNLVVHGGVEIVKKAAHGNIKYNVDDFVRHVKSKYVEDVDLHEHVSEDSNVFPWSRLMQQRFQGWFRRGPQTNHMVGPMDAVPPPKRQVGERRKRLEISGEGERPDTLLEEDIVQGDSASKETDKNMEHMWKILSQQPESTAYMIELCLNYQSFAQTIENIFTLSFLVRDGRVALSNSPRGIVVTKAKAGQQDEQSQKKEDKERVQFVMALSMGEWQEWKNLVDASKTLMPHRSQHRD